MTAVKLAVSILATALLGACASTPVQPPAGPVLTLNAGRPAPPQARHYVDCISQSASTGAYDREPELNVLRFTCTGAPAQAFFDRLASWSAKTGSEVRGEGRIFRFTSRMQRDPSGLDHCSTDADGGDPRCVVVLNVGEFLSD